jgi:hypothetical protein
MADHSVLSGARGSAIARPGGRTNKGENDVQVCFHSAASRRRHRCCIHGGERGGAERVAARFLLELHLMGGRHRRTWDAANWNWHVNNDKRLLWHWSPRNGFDRNRLPLGNSYGGGPLFFSQYTFMGVDPNQLMDDHGIDYAEQTRNHTLINRAYSIDNPKKYKGYGEKAWGLTAGDSVKGYLAHSPEEDRGVTQPTAALSSTPYTPSFSLQALRYFYEEKGEKLWGNYGFVDGFSEQYDWYARSHLAIDQGPIVVMIENHRTRLLWKLFMNIPEIQRGMKALGFDSPYFTQRLGSRTLEK